METLKFRRHTAANNMATVPSNGTHQESEVDSLLLSSCWSQATNASLPNDYLLDSQKLILENSITLTSDLNQDIEIATKASMDALDSLLLNSQPVNSNLAELKPLPPFTGYTGHLSINGIQGHHYHAIAQRIPEENNNTYNNYTNEHNIVSSSTCINADSVSLGADSSGKNLYSVDECADSVSGVKLEYSDCSAVASGGGGAGAGSVSAVNPDSCAGADSQNCVVKNEIGEYDISSIEDIAAIIGSAIADTTVPNSNQLESEDISDSRDSWMDLDAWIDGACVDNGSQKSIIISQEGLSEFILPHSPHHMNNNNNNSNNNNNPGNDYCVKSQTLEYQNKSNLCQQGGSTLQSLLTHGYMPLLQNRLQNGPPVKQEAPSSTSYGIDLISTSSPPANVVSTTDSVMLNGRYIQQTHYGVIGSGLTDERIRSPDLLGQNYPHTTTTTTPSAPKKSRNRSQKSKQSQSQSAQAQSQQQQHPASSSTVYSSSEQSLGLLGKEKPVHRCNICNRGFLNKSNIKVHLRTHTGEKPFRCDTCAKAFRQKAHLIKHQQIHKRIGRD